jgi:hypothetical protein
MNNSLYSSFIPFYSIPQITLSIRDEEKPEGNYKILEQYYNDIYKLFLNKLSQFDMSAHMADTEIKKLTSLLAEIIHVKQVLEEVR